jgi:hypothetical protein
VSSRDVQVNVTSTNATGAAFADAQEAIRQLGPTHRPHERYLMHDIEPENDGYALYAAVPCICADSKCVWSLGAPINRYENGEQVTGL